MNEYDFVSDKHKVKYFYDELQKLKTEFPTDEKLDELQKIEIDLEVKYEIFNELNKYFSPIYIEIKKKLHKKMVNKLRNENKKREI